MNNDLPTVEEQEGALPNIEELLEAMRLPNIPDGADEFAETALLPITGWKKLHTAAIVAGLMTEAKYQVNAIRLDWLQRLVLSRSKGQKKPNRAAIASILNSAFEGTRITRREDPIEDLFCDVVPTSRGDRLIFEGHWEHAAAYTDTMIQAFEELPDAPIKTTALDAIDALLRLSDALAKRAGLTRRDYHAGEPWKKIVLPSAERLKVLARRVRFSDKDLQQLGISRDALVPFFMELEHFEYIGSSLPGDSPLEFYPVIAIPNGILVAHPGVMSLAARTALLQTAKRGGLEDALMKNLAATQEDYSEWTGFWPTRQLRLTGPTKDGLRGSVCKFAPGRFQHVIQLPLSVEHFPQTAFGTIVELGEEVIKAIREDIERFWRFLESEDDYREAITIVLMGGCGGATAFDLALDGDNAPSGWRFLHVSFAEAAQLGACENGKLRHLWRIVAQVELLQRLGYSVSNINGTINLFGNWRKTKGQFIPEHFVDMEPPCNLMLPIDGLFEARLEAAQNRDLRVLPYPDGTFKRVQRIEWGKYEELRPIYGSIEDVASQRLMGAIAVGDQVWWVEAVQDQSETVSFNWQYQLWRAAMQWLAAVAPQIVADFPHLVAESARYVCVIVGEGETYHSEEGSRESDPFQLLRCTTAPDRSANVIVEKKWVETLQRPQNDAEVALTVALLEPILASSEDPPPRDALAASIRRAVPSPDWRWLHAGEVKSLIKRMSAGGLVGTFHEIPLSASALVKCGSVWRFRKRADGYEFTVEDECRDFLKNYYDFILDELIAHIKNFNRSQLVLASAERYQAARGDQGAWRTSIRALRSIRGAVADETALERQSAINAVLRAAKVVCEIAACEAPEEGGAVAGQDDLDEMYARSLLLFGNGQLYACIRAGIVPPHLKISPAGDLLSDRSFFEKTMVPATIKLNTKELDSAAADYGTRNAVEEQETQERLTWTNDLRHAIENEFCCPAEAFVDLQFALLQLAETRKEGAFVIRRSELHAVLEENDAYIGCDPTAMLERLTLTRRNGWLAEADWLTPRDLDLSRFDRRNSLINRPLLALTDEADPMVLIAPILVSDAALYAIGSMHEGSLHNEFWSSVEARRYAGARADALGREFEDEVVEVLNGAGLSAFARCSVTGLLEQATNGNMGDVDVFVISADRRCVWVIEAKNLRLCRTEAEVAARMSEYRGKMRKGSRGQDRPDKMLRHLNRVRYLREHAARLGERLGLDGVPVVRSQMVVDAPQPMNFHMLEGDPDMASCMLDDLVAVVQERQPEGGLAR